MAATTPASTLNPQQPTSNSPKYPPSSLLLFTPAALLLQRRPVPFQSIDCVKLKAEENEAATESKTRQRQIGEDGRDRQPDRYLDTLAHTVINWAPQLNFERSRS
ncbi:hypothetical protein VTJ04DRAFT_10698 [Mycothermus thermophilus]|uniref:uncharacterized protein n=1 Tax=Humicola insolens TaxID=85995 RepID=UPI0037441FA0